MKKEIDTLFPKGTKLNAIEHMEVIEKYGKNGRLCMEGELPDDTTLRELKMIESAIRTAIMRYAIEMKEYQPRLKINEDEKNEL